jgi:hypothetical protein
MPRRACVLLLIVVTGSRAADAVQLGLLGGPDHVAITETKRQEPLPPTAPTLDQDTPEVATDAVALGLDEPVPAAPTLRTVVERVETRDGDRFTDIAAAPDGGLVACGILQHATAVPAGVPARRLNAADVGRGTCFVARLSADALQMEWIALLPGGFLAPSRLAVMADGSIVVGGRVTDAAVASGLPACKPATDWQKGPAALARLSADGRRLLWLRRAGPNMADITGLCIASGTRVVYTGSAMGRQMAQYVLQMDADGARVDFARAKDGTAPSWAIYLHPNESQLKQAYVSFYRRGADGWHDYDGPDGWGRTRFGLVGFRRGGQVVQLPGGDLAVTSCLQYNFRVEGQKQFPAFDLLLARYGTDGALVWATNLYQEGDGVHTPDQLPMDLTYHASTDTLYVLAKQHGSNRYRFAGHLDGDTGNMMLGWLGNVDAETGSLQAGWYFQNNRHGRYRADGRPASPPHPSLAGNSLSRVRVDASGTVWLAGQAGAKMWTTPNAYQAWEGTWTGGGAACLLALSPSLGSVHYASVLHGGEPGSAFHGLVATRNGMVAVGQVRGAAEQAAEPLPWSRSAADGETAALARFPLQRPPAEAAAR